MVLLFESAFMLLSAGISYWNGVDGGFTPLLLSFLLTALLGSFPLIFVNKGGTMTSKESYAIVIGAWLASCFVGMFDADRVRTKLNLPEEMLPIAFLPVGYIDAPPSERHEMRKPMSEFAEIR